MIKRYLIGLCGLLLAMNGWGQSVELSVSIPTDEHKLFGTLMLPSVEQKGKIPVALLIAGSGPTDRNGNNMRMRNNSLKMVAEGLAAAGIASLRYDKRAIGESSYPKFDQSNATVDIYAQDVARWVEYLTKDARFSSITLIGHSEGSLLALMAANDGAKVDRVVSLAGAGRPFDLILKEQLSTQPEQIKHEAYAIIDTLRTCKLCSDVPVFLNYLFDNTIQSYWISMFGQNPAKLAAALDIPLLIIQGDTDIQIKTADARALSSANHNADLVVIHHMNHVLKHCEALDKTVQMPLYSNPSLPLHEELMPIIIKFIKQSGSHN